MPLLRKKIKVRIKDYSQGTCIIKDKNATIAEIMINNNTKSGVRGLKVIGAGDKLFEGIPFPKENFERGINENGEKHFELYTFDAENYVWPQTITEKQASIVRKEFLNTTNEMWRQAAVSKIVAKHDSRSNWEKLAPNISILLIVMMGVAIVYISWTFLREISTKIMEFKPTVTCMYPETPPP